MVFDIRSMEVGGYIHDYEGFYEKFTYLMSKNKGRMTTLKLPIQVLSEFSPFFCFSFSEEL